MNFAWWKTVFEWVESELLNNRCVEADAPGICFYLDPSEQITKGQKTSLKLVITEGWESAAYISKVICGCPTVLSATQIWNMLAAFGILDNSGGTRRAWEKSATLGLGQYNSKLHQPWRSVCVGTSSLKKKSYLSRTQKKCCDLLFIYKKHKDFPLNYWLIKGFWSRPKHFSNDLSVTRLQVWVSQHSSGHTVWQLLLLHRVLQCPVAKFYVANFLSEASCVSNIALMQLNFILWQKLSSNSSEST
jgi:hypothetical protein